MIFEAVFEKIVLNMNPCELKESLVKCLIYFTSPRTSWLMPDQTVAFSWNQLRILSIFFCEVSIDLSLIEIKRNFQKKRWPFFWNSRTIAPNVLYLLDDAQNDTYIFIVKKLEFWKDKQLLLYCSLGGLHDRIITVQCCQVFLKWMSWIIELQFGSRCWYYLSWITLGQNY